MLPGSQDKRGRPARLLGHRRARARGVGDLEPGKVRGHVPGVGQLHVLVRGGHPAGDHLRDEQPARGRPRDRRSRHGRRPPRERSGCRRRREQDEKERRVDRGPNTRHRMASRAGFDGGIACTGHHMGFHLAPTHPARAATRYHAPATRHHPATAARTGGTRWPAPSAPIALMPDVATGPSRRRSSTGSRTTRSSTTRGRPRRLGAEAPRPPRRRRAAARQPALARPGRAS